MVCLQANREDKQRSPAICFTLVVEVAVTRQLFGVRMAMRGADACGRWFVAIPSVLLEKFPVGSLEAELESFSAYVVLVESRQRLASCEHDLPFLGCSELG